MKNFLLATTLLAAVASPAAAASLPNPQMLADYATTARTVGAMFGTRGIDIRSYGAKCDSVTDDTVAIQNAINVAVGVAPVGFANWLAYQAAYTSWKVGIGPNPNGGAKVVLGSGQCMISAALTVPLNANSGFAMVGDSTANTQIVQTVNADGIDIVQPVNVAYGPVANQYPNTLDLGGSDSSHSSTAPGNGIYLKGFQVQQAWAGANTSTAIRYIGAEGNQADQNPINVIEDVQFTIHGSYYAGHANTFWQRGLHVTDMPNLFVNRAALTDFTNNTVMAFEYDSSGSYALQQAGKSTPGNFICQDCSASGSAAFLDIGGYGIQAVFLERPQWVTSQTGVTWLAPLNGSSGSLVIHAGSGASGVADVHTTNIGTVFSSDNFYYTANLVQSTAWHGIWSQGDFWVNENNDQIDAPAPGYMAGKSYADVLVAATAADGAVQGLPSILSDINVAGADYGVSAEGEDVLIHGVVCLNNAPTVTQTCQVDTYTGSNSAFHPVFTDVMSNYGQLVTESGANTTAVHAAAGEVFTSAIELGQPGVTYGNQTGTLGLFDFHSAAATTAYPNLNDYDFRWIVSGGTPGTVGQGVMDAWGKFMRFNMPVLTTDLRYNGFVVPTTSTAACNVGDSGMGPLSGTNYVFFCSATNQWSRTALTVGGW